MSGKATYGTLGNLFDSVFGETLACGRLEIETDGDDPFAHGGWIALCPRLER